MDRKKRLTNRLLLVCGASALLMFVGYIFYTKRPPRHYFIPDGYEGWVSVKFEKEGAPALPEVDGILRMVIPANGILETSSKLDYGWAKDRFFWLKNGQETLIPKNVEGQDQARRHIHDRDENCMSYNKLIIDLQDKSDTTLWDGARISKNGKMVEVRGGRNTLEHFYVSSVPEPFFYKHDSLPDARKIW